MAMHRFWRKAQKAQGRRRTGPLVPEAGLSGTGGLSDTARRVNRLVAVVALFGAFGTVALAVALTPGAQTSASSATAPREEFTISRIEVPPAPEPVAAARTHTSVAKMATQPAPKADRLVGTPRAPENRVVQPPASPGAADAREPGEREVAMVDMAEPKPAREAAESAGRKLDEDAGRILEFGLSEPPAPGQIDAAGYDAALEDIEAAIGAAGEQMTDDAADEAAVEDVADEAGEDAAEEAAAPEPEVAATRTAPVTTDVNMRARPSNGATVVQVVPGRSTVEVIGCDYWCEVVYNGKRGWIYKGFVRGS